MTWQTFLFIAVAGFAFGYSGWKFKTLFQLMKKHQGKVPPITRWPERIITVLVNVLGQKAVLQKNPIGIVHTTIFSRLPSFLESVTPFIED